jgi:hypothetical protein
MHPETAENAEGSESESNGTVPETADTENMTEKKDE